MSEEIVAIARNPAEMQVAQTALIEWANRKIAEVVLEEAEAQENLDLSIKNKWRTKGMRSIVNRAIRRREYYEKLKAALEAGYVIVPNFDIDVFAIRTARDKPPGHSREYEERWHHNTLPHNFQADTEKPQLGTGEYVSPLPVMSKRTEERENKDGKMEDRYIVSPTEFQEPDFPMKLVKPQILDDTAKAMAIKVFDRLGIAPVRVAKGDPMVIGQIECGRRTVSFLITWWLAEGDLEV